jgi:hypothetical protein
MPCTHLRPGRPRALRSDRLGPGRSAAPGDQRLSLLPSGPDEVHTSPLRGTRSSTSISPPASANAGLGWEFSPAGADCRYRAPLVPRLARRGDSTGDRRETRARTSAVAMWRCGGEGGIRTHDELPHTAFPVPRPRPLGDLSVEPKRADHVIVAERVGFEPTVLAHTAFRERHLQPLGHLSVPRGYKAGPDDPAGGC